MSNAEPGYLDLVDVILEADRVGVGAPTLAETGLVFIGRRGGRSANFGDCLAYATAKSSRDTLLYVGNDFSKTDIKRAAP